jgi:hypothetical protein
MALPPKLFRLVGVDGREYWSELPGALGGHRRNKLYGRLDCRSALWWLARGHLVRHRVFFRDERTAIAAGYRPCAVCMPTEYQAWKEAQTSRCAASGENAGRQTATYSAPPGSGVE